MVIKMKNVPVATFLFTKMIMSKLNVDAATDVILNKMNILSTTVTVGLPLDEVVKRVKLAFPSIDELSGRRTGGVRFSQFVAFDLLLELTAVGESTEVVFSLPNFGTAAASLYEVLFLTISQYFDILEPEDIMFFKTELNQIKFLLVCDLSFVRKNMSEFLNTETNTYTVGFLQFTLADDGLITINY